MKEKRCQEVLLEVHYRDMPRPILNRSQIRLLKVEFQNGYYDRTLFLRLLRKLRDVTYDQLRSVDLSF